MMMEKENIEDLLLEHNIRPTANRVLIVRTLAMSGAPLSVKDFEKKLLTIDKSNIFRTLTLFKEHHLVHQIEEGNGMTAYELCLRHSHDEDDDVHVHFIVKVANTLSVFTIHPFLLLLSRMVFRLRVPII